MNTPKERPILFSGPMVRAILEGRKTQTRRVIMPQPDVEMDGEIINQGGPGEIQYGPEWVPVWPPGHRLAGGIVGWGACPYGQIGDLLWVRETWADGIPGCPGGITYRADHIDPQGDGPANPVKWKPSIHMPKKAARIWLKIVRVGIDRAQDISEDDARAEGAEAAWQGMNGPEGPGISFVAGFHFLWDSINAKRGYPWSDNPWVWVIEFERWQPSTNMA